MLNSLCKRSKHFGATVQQAKFIQDLPGCCIIISINQNSQQKIIVLITPSDGLMQSFEGKCSSLTRFISKIEGFDKDVAF